MNTAPRMALMAIAALLWLAVLPAFGLVEDASRRPLVFALGLALVVLAFFHRPAPAEDPGPFLGGVGEQRRTAPSFGFLVILVGVAFALRAVSLGRPVGGDDFGFLGWWNPATADAFTARLPLAIAGALTPAAVYLVTRRVLNENAAVLTGLALTVAPAHVVVSQTVGPAAPGMLAGVLATWALASAAAHDRPVAWILYGVLTIGALAIGPWAVALPIGHTVAYLVWVSLRRLAGFPPPPIWRFLVTVVLAAAGGALLVKFPVTAPATAAVAATATDLRWAPVNLQGDTITTIAGVLALLGLARLMTLRPSAPVWLLVLPGLAACLLPSLWGAFAATTAPPWPILLAGGVLAAFGLHQMLTGMKTLAGWIFPGRIPSHVFRHAGLVLAIALLALAMTPGLRKHYHRPGPPPAEAQPTR